MIRRYYYFNHGKTQRERNLWKTEERFFKKYFRSGHFECLSHRRNCVHSELKRVAIDSSDEDLDEILTEISDLNRTDYKYNPWDWD